MFGNASKPQVLHFPPAPSGDTEARAFVLDAYSVATAGETESTKLMRAATEANRDFALNQSDAAAARRAVLAKQAYNARMNSEVAKVRAAYALLAAEEGEKAISAEAMMNRVDLARRGQLLKDTQRARARRNVLIQAMQSTDKVFASMPGLPSQYTGLPPSGTQATVGSTQTFRDPAFLTRASAFFPADIRAAAGALNGVKMPADSWLNGVIGCVDRDAAVMRQRANDEAKKCACNAIEDSAVLGFCQRAEKMSQMGMLSSETALNPLPNAAELYRPNTGMDTMAGNLAAPFLGRFDWEPEVLPGNFSILKPVIGAGLAYGLYKLFTRS